MAVRSAHLNAPTITSAAVAVPNVIRLGTRTKPNSVPFCVAAESTDGAALKYAGDFGDGSPTALGSSVTHAYTTAGNFTATVTVTHPGGGTTESTASVKVITGSLLTRLFGQR